MAYNGSNHISFPTILDIEASGFGGESYPIEVGVAASSGQRYCAIIRPCKGWTHWNEEASLLHRIPRQKLVDFGKPVDVVCTELNDLLRETTVYCDGWSHDKSWLIKLFHAAGMSPTFNLSPIEAIANEAQLQVWDETKKKVQRNLGVLRHRASSDALIIQQTFIASRKAVEAQPTASSSVPPISATPSFHPSSKYSG